MLTDGGETSWLSRSLSFLNSTPCPPAPARESRGARPGRAQGGRRTPRAPTRPPRRLRREAAPSDSAGRVLNASLRRGFISRQGPGRMYKSRVWFRGVPSARRARVGRRPALSPPGPRPRPARGGVLLHLPLTTLLAGRAPERGGTPRPTAWSISLEAGSARARVRGTWPPPLIHDARTPLLWGSTPPPSPTAPLWAPGPEGTVPREAGGVDSTWAGTGPHLSQHLGAVSPSVCLLVCFKSHRCSND